MADIIYRLSGREAADLNKEIVKTQNILNEKITQLDSLESLNTAYLKRITVLEKAEKYYTQKISDLEDEIKLHKRHRIEANNAVNDASEAIKKAELQAFNIAQDLARKNADLNDMILKVSQLEQRIKAMPLQVPETKLNKKIKSLKQNH